MSRATVPTHCPHCQSEKGWYDGPNGKLRCIGCFHELQADAKAAPEPKKQREAKTEPVQNKAVAPPEPVKPDGRQPAKAKK